MVVFSKFTVALAGMASVASAVPIGVPNRKGFTVNQQVRPVTNATKTRTLNLPGIYAKSLAKYGVAVPANVKAAAESGSATATPEEYDLEYLTPVDVGGTTLNLDFDTGSADLWVSIACYVRTEKLIDDTVGCSPKSSPPPNPADTASTSPARAAAS